MHYIPLALEGYLQGRGLHSPTPHRDTTPCGNLPALATLPAPTCRAHGSAACAVLATKVPAPRALSRPRGRCPGHQNPGLQSPGPQGAAPVTKVPSRGLCLGPRALSRSPKSRPEGSVPATAAASGTEARSPPRLLRPWGSAAPWAPPISSPEHTHTHTRHRPATRGESPLLPRWSACGEITRRESSLSSCTNVGVWFSLTLILWRKTSLGRKEPGRYRPAIKCSGVVWLAPPRYYAIYLFFGVAQCKTKTKKKKIKTSRPRETLQALQLTAALATKFS